MYVRVWEYEVGADQVDAFIAAYGATGAWARLFEREAGYVGTQLFGAVGQDGRFLTVDRWRDAACWEAFLDQWRDEYGELDHQLHGLAAGGDAVVEGTAQ